MSQLSVERPKDDTLCVFYEQIFSHRGGKYLWEITVCKAYMNQPLILPSTKSFAAWGRQAGRKPKASEQRGKMSQNFVLALAENQAQPPQRNLWVKSSPQQNWTLRKNNKLVRVNDFKSTIKDKIEILR